MLRQVIDSCTLLPANTTGCGREAATRGRGDDAVEQQHAPQEVFVLKASVAAVVLLQRETRMARMRSLKLICMWRVRVGARSFVSLGLEKKAAAALQHAATHPSAHLCVHLKPAPYRARQRAPRQRACTIYAPSFLITYTAAAQACNATPPDQRSVSSAKRMKPSLQAMPIALPRMTAAC